MKPPGADSGYEHRGRADAKKAAAHVVEWLDSTDRALVFTTSITECEIRYGINILPTGKRRTALAESASRLFDELLARHILPFDSAAAKHYATIASERRAAGRPISEFDCQIASIARLRGGIVATRNTGDFVDCGVKLVDPWQTGARTH